MPSRPDDFTRTVQRVIAQRASYVCCNPDCREQTAEPHSDPEKSLISGEACHICAASPGGPRYEPTQSSEERKSARNGIWLCVKCSTKVDKDWAAAPAETLHQWKQSHEQWLKENGLSTASRQSGGFDIDALLALHDLADPAEESFCKTEHNLTLAMQDGKGGIQRRYETAAALFACSSSPVVVEDDEDRIIKWVSPNRKYPPILGGFFVPSPEPIRVAGGYRWDNAWRQRGSLPNSRGSTKYLVLDPAGYIEYGFVPCDWFNFDRHHVFYAEVLGVFVAFQHFILDLAVQSGMAGGWHLGIALRGTKTTQLRCISEGLESPEIYTSPPTKDGFRFLNHPQKGTSQSIDEVTRRAAKALLAHWSYSVPGQVNLPEFQGRVYSSKMFADRFSSSRW
jgi:hypothetical protein